MITFALSLLLLSGSSFAASDSCAPSPDAERLKEKIFMLWITDKPDREEDVCRGRLSFSDCHPSANGRPGEHWTYATADGRYGVVFFVWDGPSPDKSVSVSVHWRGAPEGGARNGIAVLRPIYHFAQAFYGGLTAREDQVKVIDLDDPNSARRIGGVHVYPDGLLRRPEACPRLF